MKAEQGGTSQGSGRREKESRRAAADGRGGDGGAKYGAKAKEGRESRAKVQRQGEGGREGGCNQARRYAKEERRRANSGRKWRVELRERQD